MRIDRKDQASLWPWKNPIGHSETPGALASASSKWNGFTKKRGPDAAQGGRRWKSMMRPNASMPDGYSRAQGLWEIENGKDRSIEGMQYPIARWGIPAFGSRLAAAAMMICWPLRAAPWPKWAKRSIRPSSPKRKIQTAKEYIQSGFDAGWKVDGLLSRRLSSEACGNKLWMLSYLKLNLTVCIRKLTPRYKVLITISIWSKSRISQSFAIFAIKSISTDL